MSVFLDNYAIIEMARGNPRYAAVREEEFATSVGNLLEVYYVLLQSGEEDLALSIFLGISSPASHASGSKGRGRRGGDSPTWTRRALPLRPGPRVRVRHRGP